VKLARLNSRRPACLTLALSCALLLAGCGGSGSGYTSGGTPPTYTLGGSITGLAASGLVLANGADTVAPVANATSFTFPTALTSGTSYTVAVKTQPGSGVFCQVNNGTGKVGSAAVTSVTVACARAWTWMGGANTPNANGVYGTQGMAAVGNTPGARYDSVSWTDSSGNFWLYGGNGNDSTGAVGYLGDLWEYNPGTGQWTWIGGSVTANTSAVYGTQGTGSTSNNPGARASAVSWTDGSGNLWLFGGYGFNEAPGAGGLLNDLWKFNMATGESTWVSGSNALNGPPVYGTQGSAAATNVPGAREAATSWIDTAGNLWLFGGDGWDSNGAIILLNDLWEFSPKTGQWTWVSGAKVGAAAGVYGTQGTAAAGNVPGARGSAASWTDSAGNLWLFGGQGFDANGNMGSLNDLWKFSPSTGEWIWVSGSNTAGATGTYGTQGMAAAGNVPGARDLVVSWTDSAGNLWLFGGDGLDAHGSIGPLSDVWEYQPGTGQWTWVNGPNTGSTVGVFGTLGVAGSGNSPDARSSAAGWVDSTGALWVFGGFALYSSPASIAPMNDLWRY